ncbi:SRPBCC family protein [Pseudomarimonas salicorniae]|uniref:SRPBCC family protein n=1 Tax=Pseudomarimonas salicorniae TaxID=2933270 RepID=A0ABT0GKM4_9GAMM|nr:SRPBCC family protein [Lysobacter sp. CAU 1642]MCK7594932.1 SRPBCC family protein [Lysobacter sp. CAU 1642]
MYRLLELLISVLLVVALFVTVGLFLPGDRVFQHSIETNYPPRMVYDLMNGFKRFPEWYPLRAKDPSIQFSVSGEERGVGAKLYYTSENEKVGSGSFEIVDNLDPERIEYKIQSPAMGENKRAVVEIESQGKTTLITWTYTVDYGWDLLGRYAGLYVNRTVGDDVKLALGHVAGLLATMPRFDYTTVDIAHEEVEPQNMLFSKQKAKRNITAVEEAMVKAIEDLRKALAANKLEAAGPVRLITTNFGGEFYEFDVAIPFNLPEDPSFIDPAEEAAKRAEAHAEAVAKAEAAGEPVPQAPAEPEPTPLPLLAGLQLPDTVQQGVTYGGKVVTTTYQGHPAALPLLRDQLRAYAATHGHQVHDRAFEEYLTDITETAAEDAEFKIYWPIR